MVRHNDVAWHARSANGTSIGIEHVANTQGPRTRRRRRLCASAALVTWLCDTYGIPMDRTHILGHSEADKGHDAHRLPERVWNWTVLHGPRDFALVLRAGGRANAVAERSARSTARHRLSGRSWCRSRTRTPAGPPRWRCCTSFRRNMSSSPRRSPTMSAHRCMSVRLGSAAGRARALWLRDDPHPVNTSLYIRRSMGGLAARLGPLWVVIVGMPHAVVLAGSAAILTIPTVCRGQDPQSVGHARRLRQRSGGRSIRPINGYEDWLPFAQFASDFGNMAERRLRQLARAASAGAAAATAPNRRQASPWAPDQGSPRGRIRSRLRLTGDHAGEPIEPTRVAGTTMRRSAAARARAAGRSTSSTARRCRDAPPALPARPAGDVVIDLADWPCARRRRDAAADHRSCSIQTGGGAGGMSHHRGRHRRRRPYGRDVTGAIEDAARRRQSRGLRCASTIASTSPARRAAPPWRASSCGCSATAATSADSSWL